MSQTVMLDIIKEAIYSVIGYVFSDPQLNILTNDREVGGKQHLNKMYSLQIESVENPSKDDMTEWDPE